MTAPPVIAVTGANGYVGSLIVQALAPHTTVIPLVRMPRQPGDVRWSLQCSQQEAIEAFRACGATHLIHAAWDMQAVRPAEVAAGSIDGSARLLAAAVAAGLRKVIFISTISAFAGARSVYGRAKLAVEDMALRQNAVVLRLGLVYGDGAGGVFGGLRETIRTAPLIPMIGDGRRPQYLLREDALAEAIRRAARGDFDAAPGPITIAHPEPIAFRDILDELGARGGRRRRLLPVPWRLLHAGLKGAETLGLRPRFRSDSVISFVFQDPAPDFSLMRAYGMMPAWFERCSDRR